VECSQTFEEAVRILARAETIYLIGLRRSYPIVSYMSYALGTLGVRTVVVGSPNGIDRESFSFAGPRDAALAVSFSPYAPTTVEYTRQVAGQNTLLVAITDNPFSPLAFKTGVWFETVSRLIPNRRATSRRLSPSKNTSCRTVAYGSTANIPGSSLPDSEKADPPLAAFYAALRRQNDAAPLADFATALNMLRRDAKDRIALSQERQSAGAVLMPQPWRSAAKGRA
jgi:hypothetical protein